MEELIATVSDKDVADYLREALACYGAGAHRACIVLSHIALFDGPRRKVKALAPVNAPARHGDCFGCCDAVMVGRSYPATRSMRPARPDYLRQLT